MSWDFGRSSFNINIAQPDDVAPLLLLKSAAPHAGRDLDAMRETAKALKERSLEMFKATLKEYTERECFRVFWGRDRARNSFRCALRWRCVASPRSRTSMLAMIIARDERPNQTPRERKSLIRQIELQQDPLIRSHLSVLYDTLLEQNLVRVIEPYSAVELSWIAQEVGQSLQVVEEK